MLRSTKSGKHRWQPRSDAAWLPKNPDSASGSNLFFSFSILSSRVERLASGKASFHAQPLHRAGCVSLKITSVHRAAFTLALARLRRRALNPGGSHFKAEGV